MAHDCNSLPQQPVLCQRLRQASRRLKHQSLSQAQVLYLDVVPDGGADTLQRLARHVSDHLSAAGVDLDQGRGGFTPHVTVAKLSAMAGRRHGSMRKIPEVTEFDLSTSPAHEPATRKNLQSFLANNR